MVRLWDTFELVLVLTDNSARGRLRSFAGRIAAALSHRNFRLLWMGALVSSIGTWMQRVAQSWLILTMTGSGSGSGSGSAFFLGLDSFLGELPLLLFTTVGGVFADRRDRRHMILASQITQMVVALVLAVLVYTQRIHVAHVLALSFIAGCARAIGGPAYQSLIPTLVGTEHVSNAIALNAIQFDLARIVGPLVAAVALAAFGMVACFGLNAISFLFVIAAILALRDVHVPPMAAAAESLMQQFKSGLRFVRDSPPLKTVMALGFIGACLGQPLFTLLPVITRDVFHQDVGFYTRLMTVSGAGAIAGALVVAWLGNSRHMQRTLLISLMLFGATLVCFAMSRTFYWSASILFIAGLLLVMCSSLTTSLAQLHAPPELRGRVLSIYLVAFLGGSPIGAIAAGWLVTQLGSAPAVLIINGTTLSFVALRLLSISDPDIRRTGRGCAADDRRAAGVRLR
jgi:MFS family permease